jgi:hypothetical protein
MGLVAGHAYTVIAVKEAHGNRLVNVRNPWGEFEWGGDWSDNSPLWTAQMKAAIQPNLDAFDGTFWMSFDDFTSSFDSVSICHVDSFYEARAKGLFTRDDLEVRSKWFYFLEVRNEPTTLFLGVHQEDDRNYGAKDMRPMLDLGIVVLKKSGSGIVVHTNRECELDR